MVSRFVTSLDNFQRKVNWKRIGKYLNIGTAIKEKLERVMSTLNEKRRTFSPNFDNDRVSAVDTEGEEDGEVDASIQFLSAQ